MINKFIVITTTYKHNVIILIKNKKFSVFHASMKILINSHNTRIMRRSAEIFQKVFSHKKHVTNNAKLLREAEKELRIKATQSEKNEEN